MIRINKIGNFFFRRRTPAVGIHAYESQIKNRGLCSLNIGRGHLNFHKNNAPNACGLG